MHTYLRIHSQMAAHPHPIRAVRARGVRVPGRRDGRGRDLGREVDRGELLREAHEHEGRLVVCELCARASGGGGKGGKVSGRVRGPRSGKRAGEKREDGAHLLAKTDAGAGVEGEEDERVGREVLLHALVEEPVWVPVESWVNEGCRCGCISDWLAEWSDQR